MLTKNFYSFMRLVFQKATSTFTLTDGSVSTISSTTNSQPPFEIMKNWANAVNATGVSFGTGTTPATASDYFLESILGNNKINVSTPSSISFSRYDTYEEYTVTFGVTNKTAEAITISEVGLTAVPYSYSTASYALVDRTVLDAPVTIPAGQSKQITYTIRFNYGDAV